LNIGLVLQFLDVALDFLIGFYLLQVPDDFISRFGEADRSDRFLGDGFGFMSKICKKFWGL